MDVGDEQKEIKKNTISKRSVPNVWDVLSTLWVRCSVQINHGFDWILLDCRYNFLFNFRAVLFIICTVIQILKK